MTAAANLLAVARAVLGSEREAAIRSTLEERAGHLALVARHAGRADAEPAPVFTTFLERRVAPPAPPPVPAQADEPATPAAPASGRVAWCLRRIADLDGRLRAFVAVDTKGAAAAAGTLDAGPRSGPLHGVPIGVKDVVDVAGLPTEAGSALFTGNHASADATAVARARAAGAVVIGKTACTELATNDPAPTRNPWNPAHSPGGSSPGSGVAVATGMCEATIDTQTAGDGLRPAAFNGVMGFKPTYGRVSRHGTLPVAWTIDTIGVQARSVADATRLFAVIAGPDPADPARATLAAQLPRGARLRARQPAPRRPRGRRDSAIAVLAGALAFRRGGRDVGARRIHRRYSIEMP